MDASLYFSLFAGAGGVCELAYRLNKRLTANFFMYSYERVPDHELALALPGGNTSMKRLSMQFAYQNAWAYDPNF